MWQDTALLYIDWLKTNLPLPWFAFWGALLEEIVSPIPASFVQLGLGTAAQNQAYPLYALIGLAIMGALGNTLGASLQYGIYRLIGTWIVRILGKYIGLTSEKVARAKAFLQKGARDDVVIFALRAFPFVPIVNPSIIAGILGIKASTFVIATFLGYLVRNSYMLTVGFVGIEAIKSGDPKAIGLIVIILVVSGVMVFIARRHAKREEVPVQSTDEA